MQHTIVIGVSSEEDHEYIHRQLIGFNVIATSTVNEIHRIKLIKEASDTLLPTSFYACVNKILNHKDISSITRIRDLGFTEDIPP